jgi:hypothetical protein
MMDSRIVKKDMLVGLVDLRVPEIELDFSCARQISDRAALEALVTPFLLAWFDRKAWKHSPAIC